MAVKFKLKNQFKDQLKNCCLCNDIILYGTSCDNCHKSFHKYCLSAYNISANNKNCPKCASSIPESSIDN
ncbi:hypothetical protein MXB_1838 [Myxobolus squamalis]|nr:hypothetical protein MXB_1838 [Myxobolus squamalis]